MRCRIEGLLEIRVDSVADTVRVDCLVLHSQVSIVSLLRAKPMSREISCNAYLWPLANVTPSNSTAPFPHYLTPNLKHSLLVAKPIQRLSATLTRPPKRFFPVELFLHMLLCRTCCIALILPHNFILVFIRFSFYFLA